MRWTLRVLAPLGLAGCLGDPHVACTSDTECRDAFGDRLSDLARSPLVADLVDLPRARRLIDDWPEQFRYEHTLEYDLALSGTGS